MEVVIADVKGDRFPERCHLVEMETALLNEAVRDIGGTPAG